MLSKQSLRCGYRGYIGVRPLHGSRVPQHVQNLVVRDYAHRHQLPFLLSAVEYVMPGCYLMLNQLLSELNDLEGLIFYSVWMLPENPEQRLDVWRGLLRSGATLHAAVEDLRIASDADVEQIEELFAVQQTLPDCWRPSE